MNNWLPDVKWWKPSADGSVKLRIPTFFVANQNEPLLFKLEHGSMANLDT